MIKWIVKKYAVSIVNDLIKKTAEKIDIQKYKTWINKAIDVLMKIMKVIEDDKISDEEADQIIDEVEKMFK